MIPSDTEMQSYKLYFLDRNDVVVTVRGFCGVDDASAVNEGRKLQRAHTIEICCGDRRVDRLEMRWRGVPIAKQAVMEPQAFAAKTRTALSEPAVGAEPCP